VNFLRRFRINPFLVMLFLLFWTSPCLAGTPTGEISVDAISQGIRRNIEEKIHTRSFSCRGEILCGISLIPSFYKKRNYAPAWVIDDPQFTKAGELTAAIRDAEKEALSPENYHLSKIQKLLGEAKSAKNGISSQNEKLLVDLDLLLTDSFFLYASHLTSGRINPETIHSEWEAFSPEIDLAKVLETALSSGKIQTALLALTPKHPGYLKLRDTLADYRKIRDKGGWPKIARGETLKKGDIGERVKMLRNRLWVTGDLNPGSDENKHNFDGILEQGVKEFQKRHGLAIDGTVGSKTLSALNVPVEDRIRQIELNMERFRWIPGDLGKRYILVNVADFRLTVVENEKPVMNMRVVAGKPFRKTPVFSEKMKYIELNPYWNVPPQLAVKDVAPKVCRSRRYLTEKKMEVFAHWGQDPAKVNPDSIDWCRVSQKNFRYKIRQQPGPKNALGRIKFMFPNKYSVYLHDTPERALFDKTTRDFSSGCIRIEKPIDLALYLLKNDALWTAQRLSADIAEGKQTVISLQEPVFVHLLYWTSWADDQGKVHFRDDVYERDIDLDRALRERPPGFYDEANR
jgi:L,D-transpeptidase YcbB